MQADETPKDEIIVEVAYAQSAVQVIISLRVKTGFTAQQAIELSGVLVKFPEIDLKTHKIGIFGKLVKLDRQLQHLDRVEIYRPLIADPKEARRKRAGNYK